MTPKPATCPHGHPLTWVGNYATCPDKRVGMVITEDPVTGERSARPHHHHYHWTRSAAGEIALCMAEREVIPLLDEIERLLLFEAENSQRIEDLIGRRGNYDVT